MVEIALRFLIEEVGQVEGVYPTEGRLAENFLLKRTASHGIELMGILAFRASPIWVLAALADASGGGRKLIREISQALKEDGLLEGDSSFGNDGASSRWVGENQPALSADIESSSGEYGRPARRMEPTQDGPGRYPAEEPLTLGSRGGCVERARYWAKQSWITTRRYWQRSHKRDFWPIGLGNFAHTCGALPSSSLLSTNR
jgi:hypothetical protein